MIWRREGNVLFNDALNTFYLRLYGVRHMVKNHSEKKITRCRHIGYSLWLAARVLLYASSHRQDNTYHDLCYTSGGALAGMRNSSMGPPHEGSIRWSIAPWANTLTTELHLAPILGTRNSSRGPLKGNALPWRYVPTDCRLQTALCTYRLGESVVLCAPLHVERLDFFGKATQKYRLVDHVGHFPFWGLGYVLWKH